MNSPFVLGIDTSCYTTSVAAANDTGIVFDKRTMLFVPKGERGLRQSDGVFLHVRQLPALIEALFASVENSAIAAVCVSEKPSEDADSYMPVFLSGLGTARALSAALHVPLISTTHQRGHIRAACIGNEPFRELSRFYALHLSGGTTDVLLVCRRGNEIERIERVAFASDLHVGQFVDRVGVALGLPFPSGKHLETLAQNAVDRSIRIPASVKDCTCSFSGAETQCARLIAEGVPHEAIAYGVYDCIARTLMKLLSAVRVKYGDLPALSGGGVSSSLLLRRILSERGVDNLHFSNPDYASDNACGVALIGWEALQ